MAGLIDTAKTHWAAYKFRHSTIGQALADHTARYFYSGDVLAWIDKESKERLIQDFYGKLIAIAQSPNPLMELRTLLANYTVACCGLNVLCLRVEEKAEQPFAANPYISGQLHRHIVQAAPHNEETAQFLWQHDGSAEDLLSFANSRSALLLYYVNGLNMARNEMRDSYDVKDWFQPFFEAMMVWEEDGYRDALGLPRLLPEPLHALPYSSFLNYVVSGERNPFFTWTQNFPRYYLAGEGPFPQTEGVNTPTFTP